MREITERILHKTRSKWFRVRPIFEPFQPVDASEIERIEIKVGCALPHELKAWLLAVGYGDVDEVLSFRYEWFHVIDKGHLTGSVIFAQDNLGSFYAYSGENGNIHYFERSSANYATVAPNFGVFMEQLEQRDFKLSEWMDTLELLPYEWRA